MLKIESLSTLIVALLLVFISACKTKAQQSPPSVQSSASTAVEDKNALLWEITGKDLSKPSYLYGTIHLIPKNDFFLTEATKKVRPANQARAVDHEDRKLDRRAGRQRRAGR